MAKVRVNKMKIANGPNLVIKNVKNTVIILLTSSNNFFKTVIWSPKWLIDNPVTRKENYNQPRQHIEK